MTELQEVQQAGAKVIEDAEAAYERGELSDAVSLVFRLMATAAIMKPAHQPAARKIVSEACRLLGFDFSKLEEQVEARIYEHVQLARLERDAQ